MDVDLLKTFLEVYHTRHFARAADNLFITPSAVSARIRLLETRDMASRIPFCESPHETPLVEGLSFACGAAQTRLGLKTGVRSAQ